MNIRLAILFIVCVVVPTSVLSLMAAISVRRWEAVAAVRQEREAVRLVRAARSAADIGLRTALARVRERLAVSLAAGKTGDEIRVQAARAEADSPLVERVFVFMNPWGFVHPKEGSGGRGATNSPDMAALEAAVRRELSVGGLAEWVPLQVGDQAYVFGAMGEGRGLHVGFRVRQEAAMELVRAAALPGDDMQVLVLRSSDEPPRVVAGDVVVSDPLGGAIRLEDERGWGVANGATLAEARLAAPLRHVAVRVQQKRALEGLEAANIRTRLQLWGIVLLGFGILAGVGVILRTMWADLRRSRNQADLVLGVSHDLRTPATSIRALAESLSLGHVIDPDKQKRFIDSILREAERLSQLTERVLYLLRFDQGAVALSRQSVDLRSLVEEAVSLFLQRRGLLRDPAGGCTASARVGKIGVTVRWTLSREAMCTDGDSAALLQTLSNLLDNAWQYTVGPRLAGVEAEAKGAAQSVVGTDAEISIKVEPASERAILKRRSGTRIAIEDNGIGLRPEEQRKLFRRFYRAPGAKRLHASGVGLGLAFCRYVVSEHGGSIRVLSQFGKGAEFSVWLPSARGEVMAEGG